MGALVARSAAPRRSDRRRAHRVSPAAKRRTQGGRRVMPDEESIQRVSKRVSDGFDGIAERIDNGFASIRGAMDEMALRIQRIDNRTTQRLDAADAAVSSGLAHVEIGLGELRDRLEAVEKQAGDATKAAEKAVTAAEKAVGAAERADTRAQEAVSAAKEGVTASRSGTAAAVGAMRNSSEISMATAREQVKAFWATTQGRIVKWCAGIAAAGAAITALPSIAKFVQQAAKAFWGVISGGA